MATSAVMAKDQSIKGCFSRGPEFFKRSQMTTVDDCSLPKERAELLYQWASANCYVGPESLDAAGLRRFRTTNPVDRTGLYLFQCSNGDIYIGLSLIHI